MLNKPRTNEDVLEAITAIKEELVKGAPRPVFIVYPIIIEALTELLVLRRGIEDS